jgi:hypothetical protein
MAYKSKFAKRHYREIADAIRTVRALPHDCANELWTDLIAELCQRFKQDNGDFRAETFRAACGVNGFDHREAAQ